MPPKTQAPPAEILKMFGVKQQEPTVRKSRTNQTAGEIKAMESIPRTPGIYIITNTANGYMYIGSAVNLRKRWSLHCSDIKNGRHHNPRLLAAWRKYGAESFKFEVLEHVSDASELLLVEQKWLDFYRVSERRDCYNFCAIAGSHLGRKRSLETCQKLSKAMTGKSATPESKAKMRAAKLGRKLSLEHRAKLSESRRGQSVNRRRGGNSLGHRMFSVEQVGEMRRLKNEGWSYSQIESKFRISHGGLQKIINRETYRDVLP